MKLVRRCFPPFRLSLGFNAHSASFSRHCRLFRRLLRAHRSLPADMRSLGDDYVKSGLFPLCYSSILSLIQGTEEFRLHRETTNPIHVIGFLSQWKIYLEEVLSRSGVTFYGKKLDPAVFGKVHRDCRDCHLGTHDISTVKMSNEQIGQLYELMHAAKNVWKPVESREPDVDPRAIFKPKQPS